MKNGITRNADYRIMLPIIIAAALLIGIGLYAVNYFEARADMYITPTGFKGKVTILFGQPNGIPEKKYGERRIFQIPMSGFLATQSVYEDKWCDYYYQKPDGQLHQLSQGNPRYGGMAVGAYNIEDTIFIREIATSKQDCGGDNEVYTTTYEIDSSL